MHAPNRTLAVADHNIPTTDRSVGIEDEESRIQVEALEKNAFEFGVPYFAMDDIRQGIVHVIGPEQGFTLPGMTIVCGDSHTATHGAFGALVLVLEPLKLSMSWRRKLLSKSRLKTCELMLMVKSGR